MKAFQQKMVEVKKSKCAKVLKELKLLCGKLDFTTEIFVDALEVGSTAK